MARSIKTAQVNPTKATRKEYIETETSEVAGYLTASQCAKLQKKEVESFVDAFQSQVPVVVADISFQQLSEAFEDTQNQFEQADCDERSIKKIVSSIALGDSGLMKPVTITEYDGVMYITGGRHRTKAILYVALDVLGLSLDDDVRVLYQTVESYHQLVELIEADNAGRRMRSAELATIQSQLLGVDKEMSLEEALEHLFTQKATRSQLRKAIISLVVRENRRTDDSPLTDEGTRTLTNYLMQYLFDREYDVDAYAKTLTAYYDYIVGNYNKLAKMVAAEFGDENVIRHGKWVCDQVVTALKLSKVINKLKTQSEVKEEARKLAEQARIEKEAEKARRIIEQDKAVSDASPKQRKAPTTTRKARKVAEPVEVIEVNDEDKDDEQANAKSQRKATKLRAI